MALAVIWFRLRTFATGSRGQSSGKPWSLETYCGVSGGTLQGGAISFLCRG